MVKILIDLPKDLDKKVKQFKADKDFTSKAEAILGILIRFFD